MLPQILGPQSSRLRISGDSSAASSRLNVAGDRLSELPDGVLLEILAHLPLPDLVRTSVLSRKYRKLWAFSPTINFTTIPLKSFSHSYHQALKSWLRHCPSSSTFVLRSLSFVLEPESPQTFIFHVASRRAVRHLSVSGYTRILYLRSLYVELPNSFLSCSSLIQLDLSHVALDSLNSSGSMGMLPNLQSINLANSFFTGEVVAELLALAPCIKSLCICSCELIGHALIKSATLLHLGIIETASTSTPVVFEIMETPELTTFLLRCGLSDIEMKGDKKKMLPKLKNVSLFSRFGQAYQCFEQFRDILRSMESIDSLCANNWFLQVMDFDDGYWPDTIFHVKQLHLCIVEFCMASLYGLALFLMECGVLQLYLHLGDNTGKYDDSLPEYNELEEEEFWRRIKPDKGTHCNDVKKSACSLDVNATITGFSGTTEEMILLKLLIVNVPSLDCLYVFHVKGIGKEILDGISNEIKSLNKANSRLKVSLRELPPDYVCQGHTDWCTHV